MKQFKVLVFLTVLIGLSGTISSCGNKSKSPESNTEVSSTSNTNEGKEYTSAYICPMHCKGSGSDKEGKCPVCEMDYVKNKDHKSDGHTHDHSNHNH